MKTKIIRFLLLITFSHFHILLFSQNVGVNILTPLGKLHVKGSNDISQLIIDANATQSNINPLIRLRKSTGSDLLWLHSDDSTNVFLGFKAGRVNVVGPQGINNSFIGSRAGYSNTNGRDNTAIGTNALFSNTSGFENTATGSGALSSNILGLGNTANGFQALFNNTSGLSNTAIGRATLSSNETGSSNTATGYEALTFSSTGSFNTANGYWALKSNVNGSHNTANGTDALRTNLTSSYNTAMGDGALYSNITGPSNTACGANALYWLQGGNNNVALGENSGTASAWPNINNTISIGNKGYLNAATNQAFLGNLTTGWNGGNVTWSTYSDARVKNNVREDVKGLEFITRLRPVTYYRNIKAMTAITGNEETEDYPGKYDIEKIKFTGFLAQEVELAAQQSNYDFSGITIPKNSQELYTLSYEQFVVPLVKAVQEQQAIIVNQQSQIDALVQRLEALERK